MWSRVLDVGGILGLHTIYKRTLNRGNGAPIADIDFLPIALQIKVSLLEVQIEINVVNIQSYYTHISLTGWLF